MYIIPFDSENLKKIITGEIFDLNVDYVNSKLKGKNFITYFSNLKYKNINIILDGMTVEDKEQLVLEYIKHQSMVNIEQLESTMLKCLFQYKGFNFKLISKFDMPFLNKSILTDNEIVSFIEKNKETIDTLVNILDGVLLYAIKNLNSYKEEFGDKITDNLITDKKEIGKTFVNLFSNETFNYYYYTILKDFKNLYYFEYYYDKPIYFGKTLISYITGDCVIFPLLKMGIEQQITSEQIKEIYEETDAALI